MALGARPPNIRDVARRAGVSATTVSRVLNGTLEPAASTRSSIEAAIRDLGYVPNPHARRLGRGRSDALALLVPDISAPFFARLVAAAEAEAGRRGLELELHVTMNRPDRERRYLQAIQRNHVDGVIVATNHPDDGSLAEAMSRSGRVVLVDEDVPGATVPKIMSDNREAGRLAGRHLAAAGHRRVLFLGGPPGLTSTRRRRAGLEEAVAARWGAEGGVVAWEGSYSEAFGQEAGRRVLAERPAVTAAFVTSDEMLIGFLGALRAGGLAVPGEMSVIGHDDVAPLALFDPPVSAIRQPVDALGARAVALLAEGAAMAPGETLLPVSLVERRSVAAPARSTPATANRE